jgi:opacity protein-like surface antigen
MKRAISLAAVLAALATPAFAADTVQSLIAQDFVVVGIMASQIGPGLFLQKKDKLFPLLRLRDREVDHRRDALLQAGAVTLKP